MNKRELSIAAASAVAGALMGALVTKLYYEGRIPTFPHVSTVM